MKKLTLLGDSIRMIGYGKYVPDMLKDEYETYQPSDNCRFSKYTLRGVLHEWKKDIEGSDIIHWNNGLWDVCNLFGDGTFSTEAEYTENILRIADILLKRYDKVIFATTTPVRQENQYNSNEDIKRFNDLIVPLLKEKGVIINDLYQLVVSDINTYIREEDNIHLSEEGIRVCAQQVAEIIRISSQGIRFL